MRSIILSEYNYESIIFIPGAGPGFPVGGGANPPGTPTYDFAKISQKLHEIEKILDRGHPLPLIRHCILSINASAEADTCCDLETCHGVIQR